MTRHPYVFFRFALPTGCWVHDKSYNLDQRSANTGGTCGFLTSILKFTGFEVKFACCFLGVPKDFAKHSICFSIFLGEQRLFS